MALTPDETAELASLTGALTALRTGKLPSRVVYNGRETAFAKVDLSDLRGRVEQLQAKAAAPAGRSRGALRFRL